MTDAPTAIIDINDRLPPRSYRQERKTGLPHFMIGFECTVKHSGADTAGCGLGEPTVPSTSIQLSDRGGAEALMHINTVHIQKVEEQL